MAESRASTRAQSQDPFQEQINKLRDVAARSTDPCITAKYIAIMNREVMDLVRELWDDPNYELHGIYCLEACGTHAWQDVLFDFRCRPGVFCLVEPWFLVGVDVRHQRAAYVQNPYLPATTGPRPRLDLWGPGRFVCDVWGLWLESRVALWQAICSAIPCEPVYSCGPSRLPRALKPVRPSSSSLVSGERTA